MGCLGSLGAHGVLVGSLGSLECSWVHWVLVVLMGCSGTPCMRCLWSLVTGCAWSILVDTTGVHIVANQLVTKISTMSFLSRKL